MSNKKDLAILVRHLNKLLIGYYSIVDKDMFIKFINSCRGKSPQKSGPQVRGKKIIALSEKLGIDDDTLFSMWKNNKLDNLFQKHNYPENYNSMPKPVNRDNKGVYNVGSGYGRNSIRVPSLKRNNKVWKNFYELFPTLEGLTHYMGIKLKKKE